LVTSNCIQSLSTFQVVSAHHFKSVEVFNNKWPIAGKGYRHPNGSATVYTNITKFSLIQIIKS